MNSLLILGEKHSFSKLELKKLKNRFPKIDFVKYNNLEVKDVIENISFTLDRKNNTLMLLNTKVVIPNKLLSYLTKLEQKGINYITIQSFMERYLYKCYIPSELTDISFLENIKPFSIYRKIVKYIIDYSLAISLAIIGSPVAIYSIYRIKKESKGTIFFKQTRVGLYGEEFTCYKFRSMHENSPHDPYTRENDDRVFPWGNIMRKTRIDELPQIWNVLKGDMSIIGPRAEWNILVKNYEEEIPYYQERHLIKPGITGWAQVNYHYGTNGYDAKQKLMYDLYYIKRWNLWLEIRCVWRTVLIIIGKKGL